MSVEQWRPIPGHERWQVSDLGRIRGPRGRVLRPAYAGGRDGTYQVVSLSSRPCPADCRRRGRKHAHQQNMYVHRAVMLAFVGPAPDGHTVDHGAGGRYDNRLVNLAYVPAEQNSYEGAMRRHYGPVRTDWTAWEADNA